MPRSISKIASLRWQNGSRAVLLYFRRELWQIGRAFFVGVVEKRPFATTESRLGWYILIGSIPAGAAGLLSC